MPREIEMGHEAGRSQTSRSRPQPTPDSLPCLCDSKIGADFVQCKSRTTVTARTHVSVFSLLLKAQLTYFGWNETSGEGREKL